MNIFFSILEGVLNQLSPVFGIQYFTEFINCNFTNLVIFYIKIYIKCRHKSWGYSRPLCRLDGRSIKLVGVPQPKPMHGFSPNFQAMFASSNSYPRLYSSYTLYKFFSVMWCSHCCCSICCSCSFYMVLYQVFSVGTHKITPPPLI